MAIKKVEETPEVKEYKRIHNSSMRDLVSEEAKKPQEEVTTEPQDTKPEVEQKADVKLVTPEEDLKREEKTKKRDEELEVLKESTKSLQDYVKEIRDSQMSSKEKKEAIKELKANWTGHDATTGQQTPKDWEEVVAENLRLSKEQTMELLKEQFEAFKDEIKKEDENNKRQLQEKDEQYKKNYAQVEQRVNEEMEELYQAGKFKKPVDMNDQNDPAVKNIQDLFLQLNNFNNERQKEGKPPYDSVSRYALLYYKPSQQREVAGADAPIVGNSTVEPQNPQKVDYRDIHNLSFRQLIKKLGGR